MNEMLEHGPTIFSGLALLISLLVLWRIWPIAKVAFVMRDDIARVSDVDSVADVVRQEVDRTRSDADEKSRGLRQEVGENIRGFQDSTLLAFGQLSDQLGGKVGEFSKKLDDGLVANQDRIQGIGRKLDEDIARMGKEAGEGREKLRGAIDEKLSAFGQQSTDAGQALRVELAQNFKDLGGSMSRLLEQLGTQQKERLEKVASELAGLTEKQVQAQETLRLAVEGRLDALRSENSNKLDEIRKTVDEKLQTTLEKRLSDSFKTVSEQLERVYMGLGEMQKLAAGVGDLKKVLSNVKTRGIWGEIQLGVLLEQFLSPEQFLANAQVREGSAERVEFAIRMPGRSVDSEVLLPIDAKFPQEDFERLVHAAEQSDTAAVEEAVNALLARVRQSARAISDKYINPPQTTDFAILFLPTEGLYAEVLRRPGFTDQLQREYRVTVVGPTTLTALLNALQMGFRTLAIEKRSSEVWQVLGAVRTEFSKYGDVVGKLKKQLETAANTIDTLGTRTRAMNRKLQGVEIITDDVSQTILGLPAAAIDNPDDENSEDSEDSTS
jgi:DNA recombination protein RmuC